MVYEVCPKQFGFTPARQLLLAVGTLSCFALVIFVPSWIYPSDPWTPRDVLAAFFCWVGVEIQWYWEFNYTIEVDDTNCRSRRVLVRNGHVRYLREIDGLIRGRRLEVSEHGSVRARMVGGVISIPKGLTDYEQIKAKIATWAMVNTKLI